LNVSERPESPLKKVSKIVDFFKIGSEQRQLLDKSEERRKGYLIRAGEIWQERKARLNSSNKLH